MIQQRKPPTHFCFVVGDYVLEEIGGKAYLSSVSNQASPTYEFSNGLGTLLTDSLTLEVFDAVMAHLKKFKQTVFQTSFQQAVFAATLKEPTPEMEHGKRLKQAFANVSASALTCVAILSLATSVIAQCEKPPTQAELDAMPTVYQEGMTDEQIEEALRKAMPNFGFCTDGKNADNPICQPGKDGTVGSVSGSGIVLAQAESEEKTDEKKQDEGTDADSHCSKNPKNKECQPGKDGDVGMRV